MSIDSRRSERLTPPDPKIYRKPEGIDWGLVGVLASYALMLTAVGGLAYGAICAKDGCPKLHHYAHIRMHARH